MVSLLELETKSNWLMLLTPRVKIMLLIQICVGRPSLRQTLWALICGLVLSAQLLQNVNYRRHIYKMPDLEKRARLLSAEYREIQKARPIEVVSVSRS